jgi:putative polyhydroxyalkanoate system protein
MKVQKAHCLGKDEARKRVADVAESLSNKYGVSSSWDGDELKIDGSGVSGCITVAEQSVNAEVKLGFALSMMESTIRTSLEEALDKHLS